jgi:hypothetical protein
MIAMPPTSTACGRRDGQTNVTHERDVTEPYMALVTSVTLMDVTDMRDIQNVTLPPSRPTGKFNPCHMAWGIEPGSVATTKPRLHSRPLTL